MMGYTLPAVLSVPAVVAAELLWLRTGLFRRPGYWISMAIVVAFQVPVDGWLTRLPDPIVGYNPDEMTGLRFPFDIPVEDYLFGFSLVSLTLLCWLRAKKKEEAA
ncbi:lycopene cyclase domain-containing protein [Amycolatopsis sacchari]|uniref:lycopene cyclase domain-containing protein n=1 Tax=Amycolatopsis sacchari TaxID=115433 RepID=UPI003D71A624